MDAVLSVTVPTAVADPGEAVAAAVLAKPVGAVLLEQAEHVRLLPRAAGVEETARDTAPLNAVPCYAYPEGAARALGHAVRYGAWLAGRKAACPTCPGSAATTPARS